MESLVSTQSSKGEWLPAISLLLFLASTTVIDTRLMLIRDLSLDAFFLPGLVFIQGYVLWFYFNKFRPAKKMFAIECPGSAHSYSWLFVMAMVGTSVVALIGLYVL
jgi:hypothetical protein